MDDHAEQLPDEYMVRTGLLATLTFALGGTLLLFRPVLYTPTFPVQQVEVPYPIVVAVILLSLAVLFALTTVSLEIDRRDAVS